MTNSHSSLEPDLLDRYFAKETTAEETHRIEQWFAAHPEDSLRLRVLHAGLVNQGGVLPPYEHDARVAAVVDFSMRAARRNRVHAEPYTAREQSPYGRQGNHIFHRLRPIGYGIAASLVASLLIAVIGLVKDRPSAAPDVIASQPTTYATGNGERKRVTLPDGSTVVLNAASRLEIPRNYLTERRTLRLAGEAIFSVQPRSDIPFTVEAGGVSTRVLGTEFGVRRYATDSVTRVAVRNGKVAVQNIVVTANQQVIALQNGMTQVSATSEAQFAFEQGLLMFDGVPLVDAIADLNRWYDVDIRLGDPGLKSQELWAKLSGNSQDDLVALLEMTFRVRVVRDGRILLLYPRQKI